MDQDATYPNGSIDSHFSNVPRGFQQGSLAENLQDEMLIDRLESSDDIQLSQPGQMSTIPYHPVVHCPLLGDPTGAPLPMLIDNIEQTVNHALPEQHSPFDLLLGSDSYFGGDEGFNTTATPYMPFADTAGMGPIFPGNCELVSHDASDKGISQDYLQNNMRMHLQDDSLRGWQQTPNVCCPPLGGPLQGLQSDWAQDLDIQVATRKVPKRKDPPSFQKHIWEKVMASVHHLDEKGWTKNEISEAFEIGHPGIKVAPGTLYNKLSKEKTRKQSRPDEGDATYSSCGGQEKQKRQRPSQGLPPRPKNPGFSTFFSWKHSSDCVTLCMTLCIQPDPTKERWIWQYKMLHAIDCLSKGFFDLGRKGWKASAFDFVSRNNRPSCIKEWQLLSARCDGIADISRPRIGLKASYLLFKVVEQIRGLVTDPSPAFLVYFWQICMILSNIRLSIYNKLGPAPFLTKFLWHLKDFLLNQVPDGAQQINPLIELVNAVTQTLHSQPILFKESLGMGCWKTIIMLSWLMGSDGKPATNHPILLRLGVYCAKTMRTHGSIDDKGCGVRFEEPALTDQYRILMKENDQSGMETRSLITCDYLSIFSKRKHESEEIKKRAKSLLELTKQTCNANAARKGSLIYNTVTHAFALASEILALSYLESWKGHQHHRDRTTYYMSEAIRILRCGDEDCCVKAAVMSKRLEMWTKSYAGRPKKTTSVANYEERAVREKHKAAHEEAMAREKHRTREIMATIKVPEHIIIRGEDKVKGDGREGSKNNRRRRKLASLREKVISKPVPAALSNEWD